MENKRAFSRQTTEAMVVFKKDQAECMGEIRNIGLGGLLARVPKKHFEEGDSVWVGPPRGESLEYEVCWRKAVGAGFELGLRYPHSIAGFWESWAADLLAGSRLTNGEVVERRSQVRLDCVLRGSLKLRRKQFPVKVLDLGAGGALLELSENGWHPGTALQLTIKDPVRVGNLPCRIARAWRGSPSRYGVSFENLRERHRLALVRLLDLLLRQSES